MPTEPGPIELDVRELRAVTGWAAECASRVLPLFEQDRPGDPRPREAVEAARAFAAGGPRTTALRQSAWAAYKAAREAATPAAAAAARSASHAAAAAFLHPRASAHQVKHVLGSAAQAALAEEENPAGGRGPAEGTGQWALRHAPREAGAVLGRLPAAPPGGGRAGEHLRALDAALRAGGHTG
ncbi:putative immunity protein [Streptomyces sp. NPDC007088]|uniref:putative immunity protein n=1 Tax=Streptomyces sp. NPDC007088 TaxID=3364773 RepID=UPI0036965C50